MVKKMKQEIKERIEQINKGIVPEGYKKTKIGIVPLGWDICKLEYMFSRLLRKNDENNTNVLTISAQKGLISQSAFFNKDISSENKSNYYLLYNGDFAYNKSYSSGYPFGAIKQLSLYEKGIVSPLYICMSKSEHNKCSDYYLQYFEAGLLNREIKAIAQEGARNHGLLNISVGDFFNTNILLPPSNEQKRIAEILATQDRVIELKEKLIDQKKLQKKYLMQSQFNNKAKNRISCKLKDCISEVDDRSSVNNQYDILSVTKDGIKKQADHFNHQVASANNTNYKIIKKGQLALSILNLWMGSLDVLTLCDIGIISPAYKVFAFDVTKMLPDFGRFFLRTYNMIWLYNINSYTGASVVRKNLDLNSLLNEEIFIPEIEEQKKITNIMNCMEKEVTLLEQELEQEKQKKKALMQLLLTGIVRVK